MKLTHALTPLLVLSLSAPLAFGQSSGNPNWLKVSSFLTLEYDDNVYEQENDTQDSFKIVEDLDFTVTLDKQPTFLTLNYSPAFVWWSDREPDDTDLHHSADIIFGHEFTPRVTLGVKNNFRIAEQPEENLRGTTIRDNNDYTYNQTSGNLGIMVAPRTQVELGGRYSFIAYDEDDVAVSLDQETSALGLTLRQRLNAASSLSADYRLEEVSYDNAETAALRDLESHFIGVGYEQVAGAIVGILRAGYQMQSYEDDRLDDQDQPYFDATLAYTWSPRTRMTLGLAYSMLESDVASFASQDRTIVNVSITHRPTGKIRVILSGSYRLAEYDDDTRVDGDQAASGDETATQLGARIAYKLDARNSIEFGYSMFDLSSDLRDDFDRNRVSLGWRLDI
jgi:hypothetical protein